MPTVDDLIVAERAKQATALERRAETTLKLTQLHASELKGTAINGEAVADLRALKRAQDQAVKASEVAIAQLERDKADDAEVYRQSQISHPTAAAAIFRSNSMGTQTYRIGVEARTYRAPDQRAGDEPSFLRDLFLSQVRHDPSAGARLERQAREVEVEHPAFVQRSMGTGAVAGFVPPQYLMELFADYARAARPVANLATSMPLPQRGTALTLTRVTTPTLVASQSAENTTVANQDLDDTLLSVPVVTVAGYVDVSRQSLERAEMVEAVVLGDLAAAYNSELDRQIIAGSGAAGQHLGLLGTSGTNAITYTTASPTAAGLWPKLADALGKIQSLRYTGATALVMHPNTWAWLMSSLDTTNRPIFDPSAMAWVLNSMSTASAEPMSYGAPVAMIMGVPVVLSGNVPTNLGAGTNETRIVAADFRDVMLFEEPNAAPMQMRFDEPLSSSLGVRLLAYGYSAFTAGRQPKGVSVISGTGLITPAL